MSERKLATIRTVSEILPIEGADTIVIAKVDGWQCVVKKDEFEVGQKAVYFEIDSFLPIDPRFEFLRKSCYKNPEQGKEGFRLKTIRLKGALSQGLLMPVSKFPELNEISSELLDGEDITETLKVTKWDPPIPVHLAGIVKGNWPSFIPKTDEERIQNLSNWFELYLEEEFEESVKLDGSSMTVYCNKGEIGVCSRNLELKEDPNNAFWKACLYYDLKNKLKAYHTATDVSLALQGELIGEGIQGNRQNIKGFQFRIFNIWAIESQRYLTPIERAFVISQLNEMPGPEIKQVPIERMKCQILKEHTMESLLNHADGIIPEFGTIREGLVYKAHSLTKKGELISFKVISNKYLEKYKE
jgi:RNA ligase (TIGR02306 family)